MLNRAQSGPKVVVDQTLDARDRHKKGVSTSASKLTADFRMFTVLRQPLAGCTCFVRLKRICRGPYCWFQWSLDWYCLRGRTFYRHALIGHRRNDRTLLKFHSTWQLRLWTLGSQDSHLYWSQHQQELVKIGFIFWHYTLCRCSISLMNLRLKRSTRQSHWTSSKQIC